MPSSSRISSAATATDWWRAASSASEGCETALFVNLHSTTRGQNREAESWHRFREEAQREGMTLSRLRGEAGIGKKRLHEILGFLDGRVDIDPYHRGRARLVWRAAQRADRTPG